MQEIHDFGAEMSKKSRKLDEKWSQFQNEGGVNRLDENLVHERHVYAQHEELDELLNSDSELTFEALQRARESYRLSQKETVELVEEMELWKKVRGMYRDASELYNYYFALHNKLNEDLTGRELKQDLCEQVALEMNKAKERCDELHARLEKRSRQREWELSSLIKLAKNAGRKVELLKKSVYEHISRYRSDYKEELLRNVKLAPEHEVVDLLALVGMHDHLSGFADFVPGLGPKAKEAFNKSKVHDAIFEEVRLIVEAVS